MSLLVRFLSLILFFTISSHCWAFDQYEPFSEDGKFGVINTDTKEVVLAPEFDAVGWSSGDFRVYEGTIAVKRNNKWALASVNGGLITQPLYTVLYPFVDGLLVAAERSRFSILNQYGIINSKGKTTIKLEYDQMTPNEQQLIVGKLNQARYRYGVISKGGKEIIPVKAPAIAPVSSGLYAITEPNGLSALFTSGGEQLSPFEFESIEAFDDQRLLVRYYNRKGLVDLKGKVIIAPIYKNIRIEGDRTRALPFKKWTRWTENNSIRDYFFDQMLPLGQNSFAVQTNENIGIIDQNESYIGYLENLQMVSASHGLLVVSNGTYQGVVNAQGKVVLPVNYDEVKTSENIILAKIERPISGDWEIFDKKGKQVGRQRYDSFTMLENGLIKARKNGKLGLLNDQGREQSPFIYDRMSPFTNGMSVVNYLGNQGIIHENGNWVITPYKDSLVLYDEFAWYRFGSESGILDFDEKVKFRTQDSLIVVNANLLLSHNEDGFNVLDSQGQILSANPFDTLKVIHSDLLAISRNERLQLFRPSTQQLMDLPAKIKVVGNYSEDFIEAQIDGQWGFVKEDGSLAVANRYEAVKPFSEGLASVKLIGKWGVINRQENILIQPSYDSLGAFYGGLALIQRDGLYGLIDREGTRILDLQYDFLELSKEYILLASDGLWGLADARGNLIRSPQFDRIEPLGSGVFMLYKNGKSGVVNLKGEDVVPLAYDQVLPFEGGFLAAEPSTWVNATIK